MAVLPKCSPNDILLQNHITMQHLRKSVLFQYHYLTCSQIQILTNNFKVYFIVFFLKVQISGNAHTLQLFLIFQDQEKSHCFASFETFRPLFLRKCNSKCNRVFPLGSIISSRSTKFCAPSTALHHRGNTNLDHLAVPPNLPGKYISLLYNLE